MVLLPNQIHTQDYHCYFLMRKATLALCQSNIPSNVGSKCSTNWCTHIQVANQRNRLAYMLSFLLDRLIICSITH